MKITVCIGSSRSATLGAAIASIQRQTWQDWELIVVGQGQDSAVRAVTAAVACQDARVRYVHLAQSGLPRARNAGIRAAGGEIIAMLDDDCEAQHDWLATLAEGFRGDPEVGLIGGALVAPPRQRRGAANCPQLYPADALYDPRASGRQAPPGWDWVGGNFAVRRSVAEQIGPFDEYLGAGTPFPGAEDTDYKLRLEAQGVKTRSMPRAVVYHTYGTRYGWRAVLRHARNYARGNGGLAAKLTLLGDPRGRAWLESTRQDCASILQGKVTPSRLPANLLRLWHFSSAYGECLRDYRVDTARGVLLPLG